MSLTYGQKARLSIEEAVDQLRNKPIKSTMLERIYLMEKADEIVKDLPQPLQLGKGIYYILSNAVLPIKEYDLLLGRIDEKLLSEEEERYIKEFYEKHHNRPAWLVDGGHITFAWEMLLEKGLSKLIEEAEQEYSRRINENDKPERAIFLQGMVWVYKAYQKYISRYGEQAKKQNMTELAGICVNIATLPPKTFYEAIQYMLLIGHAYSVYAAVNSTITYGRMDDILLPYYLRDLKAGILTKDIARSIIDDFNCKNNLILGRGEHQMSWDEETDTGWFRNPTYDTPQYVVIGGYSNSNDHINNPLTEIFAESIIPRFENPVYMFRYTKDVNEHIWSIICDKLRQNASLMVYNDETQIPAMINAGIEKEDANNYTMHGCNWPDIPGKYAIIEACDASLINRILNSLLDDDKNCKKDYSTLDEIYTAIEDEYRRSFKERANSYRTKVKNYGSAVSDVLSCLDCFYEGTIEHASAVGKGFEKYPVILNNITNIGTAADIMAAIDKLIFNEKKVTLIKMAEAIRDDFIGHEEILHLCKNANKFGDDDDFADAHAKRLMDMILNVVDQEVINENGVKDIHVFNVTTTDMEHIAQGKSTMATPDGRRAGEPLSENLSPTFGVTAGGITALLNSVSKLPFNRIHSGAFNLRVRKDWILNNEGLERLKIVLKTYFDMGGMQVQITVADTKELLDAQLHPEKYKDLMVRITGYSAVFVDMSGKAQDEIIRRDNIG